MIRYIDHELERFVEAEAIAHRDPRLQQTIASFGLWLDEQLVALVERHAPRDAQGEIIERTDRWGRN